MEYVINKDEVRAIMEKNNIKTQSELAKQLGITKNQLSVLLSQKSNPIKRNYQKLCDVLGVEPKDIMVPKDTPAIPRTNSIHDAPASRHTCRESKKKTTLSQNISYVDTANVIPLRPYQSLELFAGAGGLALGLEEAGFCAKGLVEIDEHAAETLKVNRPNWNVIKDDIIRVSEVGIRNFLPEGTKIDFVSGGYPCQAFSYAGHKLGLDDVRGTMFFYFSKIIKDLKPKVFLAENVKGLSTHDEGRTLQTMLNIYENLGYYVSWYIVHSNNYGVAQKRERIIIVGIRKEYDVTYRLPKHYDYKPVLKDALKGVPSSIGEKYPEKKRKVLELIPPGGYWRDLPPDIAKEYMGKSYYSGGGRTGMARRISWDEPSLTLTCSPAQKQTERCHPDETRPFTVREYARIQSFPDDWEFTGAMGQQYKQIGNAVPVELAKAVGLSIIDVLNQIEVKYHSS